MSKIFIIEDNHSLRKLVKEELERYSYEVYETDNFKNILEQVQVIKPDLILLDINLPYYDGFYICRTIRRTMTIPIIIISSRDTVMDQVMGLEFGADDYITKPFSMDILMAKIKTILRRVNSEERKNHEEILIINDCYTLNENNLTLIFREKTIELTKNEFKIIKMLTINKDRIVRREELLSELWDNDIFVDDNTLTVNMTRIKQRLKEVGLVDIIKTKRGVGYSLDVSNLRVGQVGSYDE
ncbi:DNA-binding response OmpR family regulator [Clostridium punense]|uniref:Stage 0 sporulation protein A homolog n=1 Tax=Clostridium punense TaxID=1054297 RepID=A0ABS4K1K1_9CLOT|nr:response regulator transcription factor [Clostridium punense]MBP2021643.1 DNA-binding response OmpR family regulator [Clostridium punense]